MDSFERMSDEALLAAASRQPEAFGAFYRRHERAMLVFFLRRVSTAEAAADLTAEVFVAALASSRRFKPGKAPAVAWLYAIANNKLSSSRRRRRVEEKARKNLQAEPLVLTDDALDGRRRWVLATAAVTLALAGGAAAATGVLHIADGDTSKGAFTIESRPVPAITPGEPSRGSVCLQLSYDDRRASFGCGDRPTAAKPFGLLVADSVADSPEDESRERVIYGLVASNIERISVLGKRPIGTATEFKKGVPGRFFVVLVPHLGQIEVVGYDAAGHEHARIGSLARPPHPPLSHAEAVAQGDPAGFAPTFAPPSR